MCGRLQWFIRIAVSLLAGLSQAGCIATGLLEQAAVGEPAGRTYITLTTNREEYQLHRSSQGSFVDRSLPLPRKALPAECGGSARFFLNGPEEEIAIGAWSTTAPLSADRAPHPDDRYPPCTVLVAYGTFADIIPAGGVVATLPAGVLAIDALRPGYPVLYVLWPAAFIADIYLGIGAGVASLAAAIPVLFTIKAMDYQARATREKQGAGLPPSVASCWLAAESGMKSFTLPEPAGRFDTFQWDPDVANAYTLDGTPGPFGPDEPIAIDERIALDGARVQVHGFSALWTDAQFVCGLLEGKIVATSLALRE